ncbi:helical backbone metal receptor [Actinoallomurus purpureus]|uniref:helical backbone metal receptor n=1 Tax=Actinoallomurus purpureus TaxID=478114 RepID=UPI0020927ECA|nr:helical backbone metal receptor [Actinoallomurus purpureus]MCO6005612.1 helical backbone metal receptor [Actinoallomurus purpureus]
MVDDLGGLFRPARGVRRVVSLVPSLTEAIARTVPGLLVGATDWCVQPPGLGVVRVGGTKNPDVRKVVGLAPDLVVANFEENREADLDALRAAGVPVWVTVIRTIPEALTSLQRMLAACGQDTPAWLAEARTVWADVLREPPPAGVAAVVPIWRRPWMVLGRDTFAGDVLARLGVANVYAHADERYPKVSVDEMLRRRPGLVVLPDEPYAFSAVDGPETFPGLLVALVSGRHLEWYGPSLTEARRVLSASLPAPGPASSRWP